MGKTGGIAWTANMRRTIGCLFAQWGEKGQVLKIIVSRDIIHWHPESPLSISALAGDAGIGGQSPSHPYSPPCLRVVDEERDKGLSY